MSDFKIRWIVNDGEENEHAYVDLVIVTKQTSHSANYELDLEV